MATPTIRKLRAVGRYAVGIDWSDGHDSILPHRHLRQSCPCDICLAAASDAGTGAEAIEVARVEQIGDTTLFLAWRDGHETLFIAEELRAICRCAHCIGEPNYPITGR